MCGLVRPEDASRPEGIRGNQPLDLHQPAGRDYTCMHRRAGLQSLATLLPISGCDSSPFADLQTEEPKLYLSDCFASRHFVWSVIGCRYEMRFGQVGREEIVSLMARLKALRVEAGREEDDTARYYQERKEHVKNHVARSCQSQ